MYVHLVDEEDVALVVLAKLVLGVHQQQPPLGRLLLAKRKERQRRRADLVPLGLAHEPLSHNLLGADGNVVVLGLRVRVQAAHT